MKNKYILIAQQGNGTNLLRSFLNSHQDLYFADELFVSRKDETGLFQKSDKDIKEFLDDFYKSREKTMGFDLKYNQLTDEIREYINENNIKVIHLIREPARTFFKNKTVENRVFHYKDVKEYCNYVKIFDELVNMTFSYDEKKYIQITYEDITRGRQIKKLPKEFQEKILKFLGVRYCNMSLTDVGKELIKRF